MPQSTYLTPEGLAKLEAELESLNTVKRHGVADRIQKAKEMGGTVDNAEYDEAKNEQAFIEGRILTLDNIIHNAVIISGPAKKSALVQVGSTVTVRNPKGKRDKYVIIGTAEADPSQGKISNLSPIGKALLGKRAGDVAEVTAPSGKLKLEILTVR